MELGMPELVIILVLVLLLFGPSKLPMIGEGLGKALRGFKDAMRDEGERTGAERTGPPEARPGGERPAPANRRDGESRGSPPPGGGDPAPRDVRRRSRS